MDQTNENSNPLQLIIGEELSAVVFVRDYVQLQFDGPGLTAINDPTVVVGGRAYTTTTAGYRDALCGQIGHSVVSAEVASDMEITIEFDDGSTISISLREQDYLYGPEAAVFHHGKNTWVW